MGHQARARDGVRITVNVRVKVRVRLWAKAEITFAVSARPKVLEERAQRTCDGS